MIFRIIEAGLIKTEHPKGETLSVTFPYELGGGLDGPLEPFTCVLSRTLESSLRSKRFRRAWEQTRRGTGCLIFSVFAYAENEARAKNERWGWGRGMKETLADKPLDFENLLSRANGARDWLG